VLAAIYKETTDRLDVWCNKGSDRPYGSMAISGARAGREFGMQNGQDKQAMSQINDYEWMRNEFTRFTG
jgi:hypothetical protein